MKNAVTITINDETAGGKLLHEIKLLLSSEVATVREIITARVIKEVEEYNNRKPGFYNGLIQPNDAEISLNGFKLKPTKKIDPEKQVYIALDAFLKNGYFLLINNKQAMTLEEEYTLNTSTVVSFVKLTPLIGG